MTEDLEKLRKLINTSIDNIVETCRRRNEDFPKLDLPAASSEFSTHGIRNDPVIIDAIALGVSAAAQLIATLQPPLASVTSACGKGLVVAGIAAVERLHVPEILREAGHQGMHVSDIVKHNGTSADKLGRILRHLATYHIFKENAPGVFSHNLISSVLDTGKPVEDILRNPDAKFDDTNGCAAWASLYAEDNINIYSHLNRTMNDPVFANSQEPTQTTIQKAFNNSDTYWERLDRPENAWISRRFNAAMKGSTALHPPSAILTLYDWTSLPQYAAVVDVGCGLGHVSWEICKIRPDLTFILEDRPPIIPDAKEFWTQHSPSSTNNIHYLGINYLEPQPELPVEPNVFLLRMVIHDLSDKYATILLKHLRKAAQPQTKLLVVDLIVEYACEVPQIGFQVDGYEPSTAPSPLLPNFGAAATLPYDFDIVMLNNFNAKERTIHDWHSLFAGSGWRLTSVHKSSANRAWWPLLIAETA